MAKYTVSNYPREHLTAKTAGILDALAANPATKDIEVNSGYRDPARNAAGGGAKKSQHLHGNAVDLDISGLSDAQKKDVLDTATKAGAKGIGIYSSGNVLHVDPRKNPTVWGPSPRGKYRGLLAKEWGLIPDWARPTLDAVFGGFNPQPNPDLPDTMSPPQTRAQVEALDRVAQAYRDPMRALDVVPSKLAPSALSRQYSQYRPSLDVARPSPMPGALAAASTFKPDNINRSLFGRDSFAPAPSVASPAARPAPAPSSLPAARQQTTVATRPSTPAATGLPAASTSQAALADAYGQYGATRAQAAQTQALANQYGQYRPSTVTSMPTVAGMPPTPAPTGLPAAKPVAQPLQHPISVPTPPAAVAPPAAVLAPALVQNTAPKPTAPPQAPRATAYDVYNGLADKALDNTGMNTVGRLPDGTTTVTNKYGVTTGMTPYGKQTAVGAPPSLPGIKGPTASKIGGAIKGAIPSVAGSTVGGLLGGPIGALIGAALARAATQPGGLLSGQQSFQTNAFGTINAAKAQGGHAFPDAPSGGYGSGGSMGASFSNRSADGMRGISPGAAAAIGAGKGGLY